VKWFEDNGIRTIFWPALSPDLNPIENMWAEVSRTVYEGGKQYNSLSALSTAVFDAWDQVSDNYIVDLCDSMKERVYNVIRNHGKHSGY